MRAYHPNYFFHRCKLTTRRPFVLLGLVATAVRQDCNSSELSIEDASLSVTPDEAYAESGDQRNPSSLPRGAGDICTEAQSVPTAEWCRVS